MDAGSQLSLSITLSLGCSAWDAVAHIRQTGPTFVNSV